MSQAGKTYINNKVVKLPKGFMTSPYNYQVLALDEFTVVASCNCESGTAGSMFLENHLLLFVLQGIYTVQYGNQACTIRRNEMALLPKATVVQYQKTGASDSDNMLDYMMFFLKDELLKEFIKMANIKFTKPTIPVSISAKPVNERLLKYLDSLKPYFSETNEIEGNLIKIKLLELLFDLASADNNMLQQLLQVKQQVRSNMSTIVEENLTKPVSLNDLAYLSGRSLSSFKRDFRAVYNVSPAHWIREKRLQKAKELLTNSSMSITDVCFMTGHESVAHFSRIFKEYFGDSPSSYKQNLK
jgi:AraC-like DNA-binding protein